MCVTSATYLLTCFASQTNAAKAVHEVPIRKPCDKNNTLFDKNQIIYIPNVPFCQFKYLAKLFFFFFNFLHVLLLST